MNREEDRKIREMLEERGEYIDPTKYKPEGIMLYELYRLRILSHLVDELQFYFDEDGVAREVSGLIMYSLVKDALDELINEFDDVLHYVQENRKRKERNPG